MTKQQYLDKELKFIWEGGHPKPLCPMCDAPAKFAKEVVPMAYAIQAFLECKNCGYTTAIDFSRPRAVYTYKG